MSGLPQQDQLQHARFYDDVATRAVADRFLASCERLFALIENFPRLGPEVQWKIRPTVRCRFVPLPGFPKILVFYTTEPSGVEIVRLLHGSRDIEGLSEELGLR